MKKNKKKKKKSIISRLSKLLVVFIVIGVIAWVGLFALNYTIGDDYLAALTSNITGDEVTSTKKKTMINALVCGINDNLTDTIIFVRYNVQNGKVATMSIPRDTYVKNEYCIGHKINSIYRGKNSIPLVEQVEELLGVNIDYYLFFDRDMLIGMVDEIGGVEVDVPIRMKYDDPTQNLHIDLKKGKQVLNGKQAEQFVRFRKNNDGTGYAMGDLQRTQTQQEFIKSFVSTTLSLKNITKIKSLIDIALANTDTNVTAREALKYATDIGKLDISGMYTCTAEGEADYIDGLSYFILDKEETRNVINTKFLLTEDANDAVNEINE